MNRIKELRATNGMKQSDLAKLLNCSPTTISNYEVNIREMDAPTIRALCDIFGCTADYLLGRSLLPTAELSEEEASLLLAYRAADPNIRAGIQALLAPYKEEKATSAS